MPDVIEAAFEAKPSGAPATAGWKNRVRSVPGQLAGGSSVFPFDGRDSQASEQYRIARTKILQHPRGARLVAVSSPQVGDGKTVSAINLAGAMALKNNLSVLLVDADLRRSTVSALLNVPSSPGLEEVLQGKCALEDAVVRVEMTPGIYFLPAGGRTCNPTELFDSRVWQEVCERIRREFDFTIIDTPPVGVVADFELVQAHVEGVVMVVRPDHTNRTRCFEALQLVQREKLLGVMVNHVPDWFGDHRGYHHYEYYGAASD